MYISKNQSVESVALQLTAYERYGNIGEDEYREYFKRELLNLEAEDIPHYNEYLIENRYESYMDDDSLYEYLNTLDSVEAVRATYFGNFNFGDEYHKINGYGNIDSYSEYRIVKEMNEDSDFINWLVEEDDLIDFESEEVVAAIAKANELLK